MKSVSLVHIKRVGLTEWRNREWWCRHNVRIWSQEHCLWWRPDGKGYTSEDSEAWVVDFPTAYDHTKHCVPEKGISYFALPSS